MGDRVAVLRELGGRYDGIELEFKMEEIQMYSGWGQRSWKRLKWVRWPEVLIMVYDTSLWRDDALHG